MGHLVSSAGMITAAGTGRTLRNTNYYELGLVHPLIQRKDAPIYLEDYSDELDAVDARGHVPVPQGPGLGVAIDWDWVNAHEVGVVEYT